MVNLNMSRYSIVMLEEVHSTNSYALENLSSLEDGTVIYTSHQYSGRGRYRRKWVFDDTENLYMSIVLKPDNPSFSYSNLTQYLSVIVCKFLEEEFSLNPEIKWPNDILINGYKISGILAEASVQNNKINGVVLGLGLNVNLKQQTIDSIDQKATSIALLKRQNYDCGKILKGVCDLFFQTYDSFSQKGFLYIKEDYIKRCRFLGNEITVKEETVQKSYLAKAIDDEGLLIVEDKTGKENKIITGDVLCLVKD